MSRMNSKKILQLLLRPRIRPNMTDDFTTLLIELFMAAVAAAQPELYMRTALANF